MIEKLLGLPLFRGVSKDRMAATVGACKFHFLKYLPENQIFAAGEPCTDIAFILDGTVRITLNNGDGRFVVKQSLRGRDVISPDFLFGRHIFYPGEVTAVDTVSILRVSKHDYVKMLNSDPVFLFNYINLLSVNAQKSVEGILAVSTGSLAERIAYWISVLTQPRSFDISLECSQRDLVSLFGAPRTSLISTLDKLREQGIITYSTHRIMVNDRRAMLALLHNHAEQAE